MIGNDRAASTASAILDFRRARSDALPTELFAEPAWDLLLQLFIADAEGLRLTGTEISRRSNIPPTILSRWLAHLSKLDLVVGDGDGDLDDALTLSGKAMASIERLMTQAYDLQLSLGNSV